MKRPHYKLPHATNQELRWSIILKRLKQHCMISVTDISINVNNHVKCSTHTKYRFLSVNLISLLEVVVNEIN